MTLFSVHLFAEYISKNNSKSERVVSLSNALTTGTRIITNANLVCLLQSAKLVDCRYKTLDSTLLIFIRTSGVHARKFEISSQVKVR